MGRSSEQESASSTSVLEECDRLNLFQAAESGRLFEWPYARIVDAFDSLTNIIRKEPRAVPGPRSFVASTALSGGATPCMMPPCRVKNLSDTSHFAALYSDCVQIIDPFDLFLKGHDESGGKLMAVGSLLAIQHARPFIESGVLHIAPRSVMVCSNHKALLQSDEFQEDVFDPIFTAVTNALAEVVNVTFVNDEDHYFFEIRGPEDYIEHGLSIMPISPKSATLKRLGLKRLGTKLSIKELHRFGVLQHHANSVTEDILRRHLSSSTSSRPLFNNRSYIHALEALNGVNTSKKSMVVFKGLAHYVPHSDSLSAKSILDLRRKEGEAFEVYRDELDRIATELTRREDLTIAEAQEAFRDCLASKVNKINLLFHNNKSSILATVKRDIVMGSAFVGVGLSSGLFKPEAAALLAGIGGFKFLQGVAEGGHKAARVADTVRPEDMYFLWRVQREARDPNLSMNGAYGNDFKTSDALMRYLES